MKIYQSKIDYWLGLPLIYPFYLSICSIFKGEWIGVIVFLGLISLIITISISTKYMIEDNFLIVKSMFVVYKKIDIHSVKKIEKTNSILSAPALSLDRIRIQYNKFDEVLISPKEYQEFMSSMTSINPNIEVKL